MKVDHGLPEPAYRQLAAILRALDLLREEGLVFTVPRRGTYVSPQK
jgi:DNA-binding transcriptional regulator YhcF (GntR family)